MIEEFASGLWTIAAPLRVAGSEFGTRMTIVRVGDGGLVLIAPCPIDAALEAEIRALGQVRAVIAPNTFHHFYFLDALKRFPEAAAFLAEGVAEKLATPPAEARSLEEEPDAIWQQDLEQCRIGGAPKVNETVFFHASSGTLILTDFCFHFDPPPNGWTGIFLRLAGAHGKLAVSRLMRTMLKDRDIVRAAVARILEWDFDRIIVTHGTNISADGKRRFRDATKDL
jgi:hypothetical protein